jgi:hypothetical protein
MPKKFRNPKFGCGAKDGAKAVIDLSVGAELPYLKPIRKFMVNSLSSFRPQ